MRSTIELGNATFFADPACELGIGEFGEAGDRVLGDMAVAGNVVAGHHRERRDARLAPPLQAGGDQAERGLRRCEVAGVGDDVGMRRVEFLRRRRNVIAAFGDRQRDDADRGPRQQRRAVAATSKGSTKSIIAPVTCARVECRPPARRPSSANPARASFSRTSASVSRTPAPMSAQSWSRPALKRSSR